MLRYGTTLAGAYYLRRGLFLPEDLPAILGEELAREALEAHGPVAHAELALAGSGAEEGDVVPEEPWLAVQRLETRCYLRNQLLRDSDWAAMASSLELRVPMVDGPLWRRLEAASFEPARSRGKSAWLGEVARARAPALPDALWSRPKTGFTVPVAEWMIPPRPGEADTAGLGSRRLALRLLEELDRCGR